MESEVTAVLELAPFALARPGSLERFSSLALKRTQKTPVSRPSLHVQDPLFLRLASVGCRFRSVLILAVSFCLSLFYFREPKEFVVRLGCPSWSLLA